MGEIGKNIVNLRKAIPGHVGIVAVSKTKPVSDILEAYNSGHRIFGENRAQELAEKYKLLPGDIEWHMVGHLQTNKVKFIAPFVSMIESIDSLKLLEAVNREAGKNGRVIRCLLQFHIAREETKYGFSLDEARGLFREGMTGRLKNIEFAGVMGMATFTDNLETVRSEFRQLKGIFESLREEFPGTGKDFKHISMGMSGDYEVAIEEGSTMIRVGSLIFGDRN